MRQRWAMCQVSSPNAAIQGQGLEAYVLLADLQTGVGVTGRTPYIDSRGVVGTRWHVVPWCSCGWRGKTTTGVLRGERWVWRHRAWHVQQARRDSA